MSKPTARQPKRNSVPYAAIQLGVSIPKTYELIRAGRLRAAKLGRRTLITEPAIADCLAQLERDSPLVLPPKAA